MSRLVRVNKATFKLIEIKAKDSGMKKTEVMEFAIKQTIMPKKLLKKK